MSRLSILFKPAGLVTSPVRHYAPYLSILRPFSSTPSPAPRSTPNPPHSHSSPLPNPGLKKDRATPSSTATQGSSQSNVSSPSAAPMDIHKLNRIEEREKGRHEGPVTAIGQQGPADPDGQVDLEAEGDTSHLTFNDVPLSDVLSSKSRYGSSLHSVPDTATISAAMELIKSYNIGAVLVRSSTTEDIVGIISTRDYIDKVSEGKHPTTASVKEFMTESPVFAFDDDAAIACLELMTKHNFRHLPVRQRKTGKAIGLVSIGDLVRIMLKQYKESNTYMKHFIDGTY